MRRKKVHYKKKATQKVATFSKPVVRIFLLANAKSTKILTDHLANNIDELNKFIFIKFSYVTKKNVGKLYKHGIRRTPTLIYGHKRYENIVNIIKVLSPPKDNEENYGYGFSNPEEMLKKWQTNILDTGDEEDVGSADYRTQEIRTKMAALQKRRPEMNGVDPKYSLKGGRKIKYKKSYKGYSDLDDDESFLNDSGVLNIMQTPTSNYVQDEDGDLILEDYYLSEAYADGKKKYTGKHKGRTFGNY